MRNVNLHWTLSSQSVVRGPRPSRTARTFWKISQMAGRTDGRGLRFPHSVASSRTRNFRHGAAMDAPVLWPKQQFSLCVVGVMSISLTGVCVCQQENPKCWKISGRSWFQRKFDLQMCLAVGIAASRFQVCLVGRWQNCENIRQQGTECGCPSSSNSILNLSQWTKNDFKFSNL